MPKQDYIIPIIKGGGPSGVKSFANLKTGQVVRTGSWDKTPNCLVSEYCPKVAGEDAIIAYNKTWDRVFGRQ